MASGRSAPIYTVTAQAEGQATSTPIDLSQQVISLTYTEKENSETLSLKLRKEDYSLFNNPALAVGTTLTVTWGYADGNLSTPRTATITKVTGGSTLTVEGKGGAIKMNLRPRSRVFQQMKRSDVAKLLATQYGFTSSNTYIDDTQNVLPIITQAKVSDATLLMDMARKEGFVWGIDALGFRFHKRDLAQAPRRTFTQFIDPGQGDILPPGVTVEQDVRGKPGAVVARGIDKTTGQPFGVTADNQGDSGRQGLSAILGLPGAGAGGASGSPATATPQNVNSQTGALTPKLGQDAVKVSTAVNQADAQRRANALYSNTQIRSFKISFPAIGDPTTTAKSVFTLGGAVGILAGNYYCTEVAHTVGSDYKMTVHGRSDGRPTVATAPVRSDASVNYGQGPPASSTPSTTLAPRTTPNSRTGAPQTTYVAQGGPPAPTKS
jgi:phage protein D